MAAEPLTVETLRQELTSLVKLPLDRLVSDVGVRVEAGLRSELRTILAGVPLHTSLQENTPLASCNSKTSSSQHPPKSANFDNGTKSYSDLRSRTPREQLEMIADRKGDGTKQHAWSRRFRRSYAVGQEMINRRCDAVKSRFGKELSNTITRGFSINRYGVATPETAPLQGDQEMLEVEVSMEVGNHAEMSGCRGTVHRITSSHAFEMFTICVILCNAVMMGVQTEYNANHATEAEEPKVFEMIERIFCGIFLFDLSLHVFVYRSELLVSEDWQWHLFDAFLVTMQVSEQVFKFLDMFFHSFAVLRLVHLLRLVRVIRLARVLRLIGELRAIILSVFATLQSLLWLIVLLLIFTYMIGVYLTQLVTQNVLSKHEMADLHPWFFSYYGTLPRSMFSLYQAVCGGVPWRQMLLPLMEHVSPWCCLLFLFYTSFMLLAFTNIATGFFVESVRKNSQNDKEHFLVQVVREVFAAVDKDHSGRISWDEFANQLNTPEMHQYFKFLDVDFTRNEAEQLFLLLDSDGSGTIDEEEFVWGCLQLHGPARSIDMAVMLHETKRMYSQIERHIIVVEQALGWLAFAIRKDRLPASL
eukprot:TRINITY_DN6392_c0_g1_i3.p1 TRINITY_DN6392_c0_g1~~TRINITY_DN6392_c0_g1_i3.p1  ORF type:complete len:602 (+),score=67.10 TRINITY_DN6392_c0_g1_i3:51-1808(+)